MAIRKKTKNIIFFYIIATIVFTASAASIKYFNLEDYPKPFIKENSLNSIIIVGENANSGDTMGAVDLGTAMGVPFDSNDIMLDTEIDNIKDKNVIIVGGPCANAAAAEIMGWPQKCDQDFEPGKAKIKLFQGLKGQGDNVALLVAGYSVYDTSVACKVLSDYKDYNLSSNEIETAGNILNGFAINLIK